MSYNFGMSYFYIPWCQNILNGENPLTTEQDIEPATLWKSAYFEQLPLIGTIITQMMSTLCGN